MLKHYKLNIISKKCKYIVVLLIAGSVCAETGFYKLVLKDCTEYLGEYSRVEKNIIYFKPQGTFVFQPVPKKLIQVVLLENGTSFVSAGEKLKFISTIEEKSVYDAKKDAEKWRAYLLLTGLTSVASTFGSLIIIEKGDDWEHILAIMGISTVGLVAPYYCFKYLGKNQNAKISSEDIELYRKIYSEEYKKRKLKNILRGSGLLGLAAGMGIFILVSTFNMSF